MEWRVFDWQSQKVGQKGEVLNRNDYKCGFCKGKGIISHNKAIRCPACAGASTVRVPGSAVICAYCNGDGSSHLNRDLTCNVCKGKGVVSIESNNIEVCPLCKGKGRERGSSMPCLTCKGKGVITKKGAPVEEAVQETEEEKIEDEEVSNGEEKN